MTSKELDKESTFNEKVERNSEICSNCYRRLKYRYESGGPEINTDYCEYEDHVGFGYVKDEIHTKRPSVKRSYCSCGVIDQGVKFRPFNAEDFKEAAIRVSSRLEEQDISFDKDVFFNFVREEISDPSFQFNEEVILEEAVENAVQTDTEETAYRGNYDR